MSGLLRRLAARALGVAPTVRPVVGWSPEAPLGTNAETPALLPESDVGHEAAPRRAPSEAPVFHAIPETDAPTATVEQLPPGGSPRVAVEPHVPVPPEPRPRSPLPRAVATRSAPSGESSALASAASRPAARSPTARDPVEAPGPGRVSHASTRDAPLLLPPQRVGRALPAPAIAAAIPLPASTVQSAIEETTEVHVTIGRIEVTAVHEAPPQRREPARPRKPKSLEEHLARRQGRRA